MTSLPAIQKMLMKEFGLDAARVQPDSTLEDMSIDSLSVLEFMFVVEDFFRVKMSGEIAQLKTVQDIASEIDRLVEERDKQ